MKARKTVYASPKLEIVPFDDEDILTVSTWGNNSGDTQLPTDEEGNEVPGGGSEIDFDDLGWT